jgi:hypothetical protein
MAALSITATQVLPVSGPQEHGIAGEAVTQGQAVYFASTGKWLKAQADGTTDEAGANGYGIALSAAGADMQPLAVAKPGAIVTLGAGAAPAAGVVYFIGGTAGALNPAADLASTNKSTPICVGIGSNKVKVLDGAYNAGSVIA